jgi:hypothetical protein
VAPFLLQTNLLTDHRFERPRLAFLCLLQVSDRCVDLEAHRTSPTTWTRTCEVAEQVLKLPSLFLDIPDQCADLRVHIASLTIRKRTCDGVEQVPKFPKSLDVLVLRPISASAESSVRKKCRGRLVDVGRTCYGPN